VGRSLNSVPEFGLAVDLRSTAGRLGKWTGGWVPVDCRSTVPSARAPGLGRSTASRLVQGNLWSRSSQRSTACRPPVQVVQVVHIGRVPVDCRSTGPLEISAVRAENQDSCELVLSVKNWDFYSIRGPDLTLQIH